MELVSSLDGLEGDDHVELGLEGQLAGVGVDPPQAAFAVALGRVVERALLAIDRNDFGGAAAAEDARAVARAGGDVEDALALAELRRPLVTGEVVSHQPAVVDAFHHALAAQVWLPLLLRPGRDHDGHRIVPPDKRFCRKRAASCDIGR
jgi:hypothetical protein